MMTRAIQQRHIQYNACLWQIGRQIMVLSQQPWGKGWKTKVQSCGSVTTVDLAKDCMKDALEEDWQVCTQK